MNVILTSARFHIATLFIDHFLKFIHLTLCHVSTNEKPLEAKNEYEKIFHECNHSVKDYIVDNSMFKENLFADGFALANQKLTLFGAGVHHQMS